MVEKISAVFKSFLKNKREDGAYEKAVATRIMDLLRSEGYRDVKQIGHGAFGRVFGARCPQSKEKVAVKVTDSKGGMTLETYLWSAFDHANVIPLLQTMTNGCFDFYVMPMHPIAMNDLLKKEKFKKQKNALEICLGWLENVLSGLTYLHSLGVSHLDLKTNNVLISKDMKAVLIDFSCVNTTKKPITKYGLVKYLRPPECWCGPAGDSPAVLGVPFDVWSFGMLALSVLTGNWMEQQLRLLRIWSADVQPHLRRALEREMFRRQLHKTFPNCCIEEERITAILNLLRGALRLHPNDRPSASALLNHKVFNRVSGIELHPDSAWISSSEDLEQATTVKSLDNRAGDSNAFVSLTEEEERVPIKAAVPSEIIGDVSEKDIPPENNIDIETNHSEGQKADLEVISASHDPPLVSNGEEKDDDSEWDPFEEFVQDRAKSQVQTAVRPEFSSHGPCADNSAVEQQWVAAFSEETTQPQARKRKRGFLSRIRTWFLKKQPSSA